MWPETTAVSILVDSTLWARSHPPWIQETGCDVGLCPAFHVGGRLRSEGQAPALCPLGTDSICGINGHIFPVPVSLACCPQSWVRHWTALIFPLVWNETPKFSAVSTEAPGCPHLACSAGGGGLWCRPTWQYEGLSRWVGPPPRACEIQALCLCSRTGGTQS